MHHFAFIIPILFFLAGCGGGTDAQLDMARELAGTDPDSALTLLRTVDAGRSEGESSARHALYTVYSHNKLGEAVDYRCDSALAVASEYYNTHAGDDGDRMLWLYYTGLRSISDSLYAESIVRLLKAENIAKKVPDNLQLGLIYRNIAESYGALNDCSAAAHYSELSLSHFKWAGNSLYVPYAACDLAVFYNNAAKCNEALAMADTAFAMAMESGNPDLASLAIGTKAMVFTRMCEYDSVISILGQIDALGLDYSEAADIRNLGTAYLRTGNTEKAEYCRDIVAEADPADRSLEYQILEARGDYKGALDILQYESRIQDSIYLKAISQNTELLISSYLKSELESKEKVLEAEKTKNMLIIACACLLACLAVTAAAARRKKHRLQIAEFMQQIQALNTALANTDEENSKLLLRIRTEDDTLKEQQQALYTARRKVKEVFTAQSVFINEICNTYYEACDSPAMASKIYAKAMQMIEDLRKNKSTIKNLETSINTNFDNLIKDLRATYPLLSEQEVVFYMYMVSGISPRAIGVLLNKKTSNIYLRKSRLAEKLRREGNEKANRFLQFM